MLKDSKTLGLRFVLQVNGVNKGGDDEMEKEDASATNEVAK